MVDNLRKKRSNWNVGKPLWILNLTEIEFDQFKKI